MKKYLNDAELIAGCTKKSQKYQELLFKKYYGYAMSIGISYLNNRDDVVEVVQDSFLKVFNAIDQYQPSQPFKYWLRKIVVNTAIDYYRKQRKFHLHVDISDAIMESRSPSYCVLDKLGTQDLIDIINKLPLTQKLVFNLFEVEGYSHAEIAERMGFPESSSRTYLTRAKKKLRELVMQYENRK